MSTIRIALIRLGFCLILAMLVFLTMVQAQTTNLSGVVNSYAQVTAVNVPANQVTVNSTVGFAVGDTVLIVQMQGATIDETNTAAFGNITAQGNAGNYELAVICSITGNDIVFDALLSRTYSSNANHGVQLVSYPNYGNVLINGVITPPAWNGFTGGVVAFKSTGTVTFGANIVLSGTGFPGGAPSANGGACGSFGNFFMASGSVDGGFKGQGIADIIAGKEQGKGKQATAGGGGNGHNCGGGGGANFGSGGIGGLKSSGCSAFNASNPGIGGVAMNAQYALNRIFLGSAGGGGQQNNAGATTGGIGGGLAIIEAAAINGSGFSILSIGGTPPNISINEDGGGGGGAGGTVLLKTPSVTSPLTVNVSGGNGGNTFTVGTRNLGPGGGGGGGMLCMSSGSLDPNVTLINSAGLAGISQACTCAHSATNGTVGGFLAGLTIPFSLTDFAGCNLGLLRINFTHLAANAVEDVVQVDWSAFSDTPLDYFEIERATDGVNFGSIGQKKATANSSAYELIDRSPAIGYNYYRIRAIGFNGEQSVSEAKMVSFAPSKVTLLSIFPNPITADQNLNLEFVSPDALQASIEIHDMLGTLRWRESATINAGNNMIAIQLPNLSAGVYFLQLNAGKYGQFVQRVQVK